MALTVPRFLLCALLGLALVPSAARADIEVPALPVPAADAQMTAAHALAVTRWGLDPCHGQVSVTWAHMGDGINARSQWMSTNGADPSTYSDCAISYNLDVDWDWPKLCTVVEHELGHLAGHDHVNNPHDVMSPYYVYPSTECAAGSVAAAPAPTPQAAPVAQTSPASSHKAAKHKKVKRTPAARRAAARRAAKARAAKARAAKARAAKARAAKARAAKGRGRARVALSADSSAHAQLFGCVLVSA
jgi:matrixin